MGYFLNSILVNMINCRILRVLLRGVIRTTEFVTASRVWIIMLSWRSSFKIYLLSHLQFIKVTFLFYFLIFAIGSIRRLIIKLLLLLIMMKTVEALRQKSAETAHARLRTNQFTNVNLFSLLDCTHVFEGNVGAGVAILSLIEHFFCGGNLST